MADEIKETVEQKLVVKNKITDEHLNKIKTVFLYVLVAGLGSAALVSIFALLIGQFNSAIAKTLLTILVFLTHALFILSVLWADKHNQVGRRLLPTSLVILTFSSIITSTLGTWDIISAETAWRAFGFYMVILGAIYLITGLLKNRIAHQPTQVAIYTSVGFSVITSLTLMPWVMKISDHLDPLYFRVVAALAILTTASSLIGLVLRWIAINHNKDLAKTAPEKAPTSTGMTAINIVIGVFVALVWFFGFFAFLSNSIYSTNYTNNADNNSQYYY